MAEIKTNESWHPNTSIEFNANGVWLRVSLNIEPGLAQYLSSNNVFKGRYRTVYSLRSFLESAYICKDSMKNIHNMLLSNCMKHIRIAKQKKNEKENT